MFCILLFLISSETKTSSRVPTPTALSLPPLALLLSLLLLLLLLEVVNGYVGMIDCALVNPGSGESVLGRVGERPESASGAINTRSVVGQG